MPLSAGDRLGPYEILTRIGAGGMGEVWKARDTRLGREVAIKTSAEAFTDRFEGEARAVAALNHTNICHLYDVGPDYLVMEYIEGTPLKGPLPLPKALDYAAQILNALDAAHSKGIIHRDLKPANILVTRQGIKLLDFGLAKQSAPLKDTDLTQALTLRGQIVGTLTYMSPEQLQAKDADARSDIFSFGLVFYEMLTGKRAFDGKSAASVIAAILEREPPALGEIAPQSIDRVLRLCLAKDPDQRWQSARDVKAALGLAGQLPTAAPPVRRPSRAPWFLAAALAIAVGVALWSLSRHPAAEERPLQFQVGAPKGAEFVLGSGGGTAISPEGRMISFIATSGGIPKLWVQALDSPDARELPGTDGAQYPFWSPDERSLGFFAAGKLKRVDLAGGPVVILADAPATRGGTWNEQGTILFTPSTVGGLQQVSAAGGTPVPVTTLAYHDSSHRWPLFLPGGRRFLYSVLNSDASPGNVYLGSLDRPGEKTNLIANGFGVSYARPRDAYPGYLLWLRQASLMAQPFDVGRAQLSGGTVAVPGAEAVAYLTGVGFPGFSVANNGTILFRSGQGQTQLKWLSREGKVESTIAQSGQIDQYVCVSIAPDGRQAGASIADFEGARDIWVIDFARDVKTRISSSGRVLSMVWSPDSTKAVYAWIAGTTLFERSANGASQEVTIHKSDGPVYPDDWSPDGRYLLYEEVGSENRFQLRLLPMVWHGPGDPKPIPYVRNSFKQMNGQFSPDGKWVAYTSDESGQQQVIVESFPEPGNRSQVSNGGGAFPRWRRDGKELFYRALDGRLMVASVGKGARGLEFGTPAALFRTVEPIGPHAYPYDVAPDGKRILAVAPAGERTEPLTVLVNWQAKLPR